MQSSVAGLDAFRPHPGDWFGNQLDIVAFQGADPDAVVDQRPLAAERIGGDHMGEQVGPIRAWARIAWASSSRWAALASLTEWVGPFQSASPFTAA